MSVRNNDRVLMAVEMTRSQRDYVKGMAKIHGLSMAEYVRMRTMEPIEKAVI